MGAFVYANQPVVPSLRDSILKFSTNFKNKIKTTPPSRLDRRGRLSLRFFYAAEATSEVDCIHFCRAANALWRWAASSITV